jgi:RNA-directed DNA polymerase
MLCLILIVGGLLIMLSSRSWKGEVLWKHFQLLTARFPLVRPKLYLPYSELQAIAVL